VTTENNSQSEIAQFPLNEKVFLSGPAGAGKTTVGVRRMVHILNQGIRADTLLVLTPQRTLQDPYRTALSDPSEGPGGEVTLATIGGLARRMIDLFWPLVAESAGFAHPEQPPIFLTLETAQYYMAHLVRPLLDQGYFESITIDRNRLYSQILDNLNKSAAVGFPLEEIGERLISAWYGDPVQRRVYTDAQESAALFRAYCLEKNLLDFSLQLEVFWKYAWPEEYIRKYLARSFRHLIYDNVEEDVPRSHDLVRSWLPEFESALLICDEGGGFRRFLGADPSSGQALAELCQYTFTLKESFVSSEAILRLDQDLQTVILTGRSQPTETNFNTSGLTLLLRPDSEHELPRFYPELLEAISTETAALVQDGMPPSEIAILAPYLSDSLRFSLTNRLEAHGIPWQTQRPSRSLHDEPASKAMLTLAELAHPVWKIHPSKFDVAYALLQIITDMDLVRAQLLTEIVYRQKDLSLAPFDGLMADAQERITYTFGSRYTTLREWILEYQSHEALPLDHFLRKLFGEVLSQPGFGFHSNLDAIHVAGNLVESIRKFRGATESAFDPQAVETGREYLEMLREGVISAQYLESWRIQDQPAVWISPAYTFLMRNHPTSVQFWLDAGSSGWYERLAQPLTQPYVLSRAWETGQIWTDADEVRHNQENLACLVSGLLHRCKDRIYLGISELGESGFEQRGELIKAFQVIFQGMES
jgi:hypothetical protein